MATATVTARLLTGWEGTTPSADTVELAALRAMADRAVTWAQAAGGSWRETAGLILADAQSAVPYLNLALAFDDLGPAAIATIRGFFAPGQPFLIVSPHPTRDLTRAGLRAAGHPAFMVRLPGGTPPHQSPGLSVVEVLDEEGLRTWAAVLTAGYPTPPATAPPGLLGGPTRFWLASRDGAPVATALSHNAHGVVSVEAVATLPTHRGQGIGAAATWAATVADPDLPAVLIASDLGDGVYRRLGYLAVTRWTLWHGRGC